MGLFQIKEKVGRLAYRLEIPDNWRIYPVFSVTQLEHVFGPSEAHFCRFRSYYPYFVFLDGDTKSLKSFEIKRLLNKQMIKRGKG